MTFLDWAHYGSNASMSGSACYPQLGHKETELLLKTRILGASYQDEVYHPALEFRMSGGIRTYRHKKREDEWGPMNLRREQWEDQPKLDVVGLSRHGSDVDWRIEYRTQSRFPYNPENGFGCWLLVPSIIFDGDDTLWRTMPL